MKLLRRFISKDLIWWFLLLSACFLAYAGFSSAYMSIPLSLDTALLCNFFFSNKTRTCDIPRRKALAVLGLVCTAWSFTYLLFVPSSIILSDLMEIPIKYFWIFHVSLGFFLGSALLLFLIGFCLPPFFRMVYTLLLFSITFAGYMQNAFLNGKLAPMDGILPDFSGIQIIINALLWIIMITIPFILYRKRKEHAIKLIIWGSAFFIGSQLISISVLWFAADYSVQHSAELTTDYLTEFHQDNNVLVIFLDSFDRKFMNDIESSDSGFLAPLKDFTNYDNTASCYSFTNISIPYLVSGVSYPKEMTAEEYMSYADKNNVFLKRLTELGCDIELYTDAPILRKNLMQYVRNISPDTTGKYDPIAFGRFWGKCARYNLLPFAAKIIYRYHSLDLYDAIYDSRLYKTDDAYVYHAAADNGLLVNPQTNRLFKMIHLQGAHAPFTLTEDYLSDSRISSTRDQQARASFGIVYKWLEELKKAGIYDQTTIIISADHGQIFPINPKKMQENGERFTPSPILFVKYAGETHDAMRTNPAPVSHEDFFATVLKAFGDDDYQTFGRSFDEVDPSEDRTRYFIYGQFKFKLGYSITGNVMDKSSWHLIEDALPLDTPGE